MREISDQLHMPYPRFRPTLLALLAAWLAAIAFVTHMLIAAELSHWEHGFDDDISLLVSEIKHKLDTNEAVLAGLSAFLQAVDRSDTDSTMKYAASATASYPHIYMIEVARKVGVSNEAAFLASLRQTWRADFSIKNFAEVTGRNFQDDEKKNATWPILFMYPTLPEAQAIYGVRLETVDYLSRTVALAQRNVKPVVSPVFKMYEGGNAYILLQEVNRPAGNGSTNPNFFGDTMMAMLLIKAQSLIPAKAQAEEHDRISISATLAAPGNPATLLFEKMAQDESMLDRLLPRFSRQLQIENASQPTHIIFERQLRWSDLLQAEKLMILILLGAALLVVPWMTVRHYLNLDKAEIEQERAAYLATHDLLTNLPNRFLFADRFDHALRNWQRNGSAFALLLLDIDHFKVINDRYGHDVGDQVLVACAARMATELRACDTVARHGGDEFVILLANVLNGEDAENVSKKLLSAIVQPIETTAGQLHVSCSIGIAICPLHGSSLDILRKLADRAMYQSKERGRDTISIAAIEFA